jgi:hypothetical protein
MKLYETINEHNWTKGGPELWFNGRRCLVGHLGSLYGYPHSEKITSALLEAIETLYPGRADGYAPNGGMKPYLFLFNDDPDTTLDDVLRVCKVADV